MNIKSPSFAGESSLLYSPVLSERLQRTKACNREDELLPRWPWGNHGAANALVVLVGPSPGKKDPGVSPEPQPRRIGASRGFKGFAHQPNRNRVWLELAEAGFGTEGTAEHREALSALFNLSGKDAPEAERLSLEELRRFSGACAARIIECRPRVVIALEKRVFSVLTEAFSDRDTFMWRDFEGVANPHTGRATQALVWQYPTEEGINEIILIRSPSHPSRPDRLLRKVSSMSDEGARLRFQGIRMTVDKFNAAFPPATAFRPGPAIPRARDSG